MSFTKILINFAVEVVSEIGYGGVFILMLLESALIPIPSEAIMPFAGFLVATGEMDFLYAVLAGTFGNLAGSYLAYVLGSKFGRPFLERYGKYLLITSKHLEYAEKLFNEKGQVTVFVGRILPAVRTVISFPAGIAKMNIVHFTVYTVIGSFIWCTALTYVGLVLKENWKMLENYFLYIDVLVVAAAIGVVLYLLIKRRKAANEELI